MHRIYYKGSDQRRFTLVLQEEPDGRKKIIKAAATSANLDAYSAGKRSDRALMIKAWCIKHTSFSLKTDLSKPEGDGTQFLKQIPA